MVNDDVEAVGCLVLPQRDRPRMEHAADARVPMEVAARLQAPEQSYRFAGAHLQGSAGGVFKTGLDGSGRWPESMSLARADRAVTPMSWTERRAPG